MDENLTEDTEKTDNGVTRHKTFLVEARSYRVVEDNASEFIENFISVEESRFIDDSCKSGGSLEKSFGKLPTLLRRH